MKTGIYKIKCLITGLIYIGYSSNLHNRKNYYKTINISNQLLIKESIKEYGWEQHLFEIIEYCDKTQLKEREKYWIKHYDSFNNGLNMNSGGGGPISHSPETRDKISKANKGKIQSLDSSIKKSKSMKNKNNIPIFQFSLEGTLMAKYNSITEACLILNKPNFMGNITACCKGRLKTVLGYRWSYSCDKKEKIKISHIKKGVLQYDLNNSFIKEWSCWSEAEKIYSNKKSSNIWSCCNHKQKTAYGFKWKYKN